MKKITNEKGITLTALIITIVILIILGAVGIEAGKDSVDKSKLTAFSIELQAVQRKVDELNQKYKNGDDSVLQIGNLTQGSQKEIEAFNGAEENDYTRL